MTAPAGIGMPLPGPRTPVPRLPNGQPVPWEWGQPGATGSTGSTDTTYTDIIKQTLAQWDLSDLFDLVDQLGRSGASADEINLKIQQSDAYKARFAGNQERLKNGLGVLSPAEYIGLEGQYRQILRSLPQGFYDTREAWANWIGGDVSPAEVSQRVQLANQAYVNANQETRDAWNHYYGSAGAGGAVAAILDTNVAEPLLEQQVNAAGIGGAALASGLALTSQSTAMRATQQGVTIDSARQAFQNIAQRLGTDRALSRRFANTAIGDFGQSQEEQATLLGDTDAQRKQQLLYSQEQSMFAARGGGSDTSGGAAGANY